MIAGLVSTIIPVFNRGAMLREAVASVLAQTWRPIEIVIVDDGSTDDTPDVMRSLQALYPETITLHHQKNAGPGAARQSGASIARGEFVQFLDSDDLLLPEKFAMQVAGLNGDPAAGIAYGRTYSRVGGLRLDQPARRTGERHRHIFPAALIGRLWETATPLYRRAALNRIGPWARRRQLEDWEFDCRAAAEGIELFYVDEYVAEYVNHDGERLCHAWMSDAGAMRDRINAYADILGHAQRAGIAREAPEMQEFVRSLFWMARSAGAHGLPDEARRLFQLARSNALHPGWDYRVFAIVAAMIGWRWAGKIAQFADRHRS